MTIFLLGIFLGADIADLIAGACIVCRKFVLQRIGVVNSSVKFDMIVIIVVIKREG